MNDLKFDYGSVSSAYLKSSDNLNNIVIYTISGSFVYITYIPHYDHVGICNIFCESKFVNTHFKPISPATTFAISHNLAYSTKKLRHSTAAKCRYQFSNIKFVDMNIQQRTIARFQTLFGSQSSAIPILRRKDSVGKMLICIVNYTEPHDVTCRAEVVHFSETNDIASAVSARFHCSSISVCCVRC